VLSTALVVLVAVTGVASAARPRVTVTVASTQQKAVLAAGRLSVTVRATGRATVKLTATAGGHSGRLSSATARFTRKGSRTVGLKLSATGRTALATCGAQAVAVKATYRRTSTSKGRRHTSTATARAHRTLARDPARCAAPPLHVTTPNADHCDPIDQASCMLPYPNDYFTVPDAKSATGRRVAFDTRFMPANRAGVHVDAAEYDRNDGFSPNNTILTRIPGIDTPADLTASGLVTQTDIGQYARADQPVVLVDSATHRRVPIWAELEMVSGSETDPHGATNNRVIIVHPAQSLDYGHHYVVAFRHLKGAAGRPLAPGTVFRAYRDGVRTDDAAVEARRPAMERDFADLQRAGIARSDLYVAWDFTVGSEQSITGRLRAMRDQAFAQLGDTNLADGVVQGVAPAVHDVQVHPYALCGADANPLCSSSESNYDYARVTGTITVPCFMDGPTDAALADHTPCAPGSRLHYAAGASTPSQNGTATFAAPFTCLLPRTAAGASTMATDRPGVVFGHGLLGDHTQTEELRLFPAATKAVACGTDWIGMSSSDLSTFLPLMLADLGKFPALPDRSQQGMIDVLYLARAMAASAAQGGMAGLPGFQDGGAHPSLATHGEVGYLGISQGGIFGGAVTTLAPDWSRAVLGVPAMGFSTLLTRSTQFNRFLPVVYAVYPDALQRTLGISMMQMLWDRGEASGYARHLTNDPLPNTPAHKVVMIEAFGDHQVANVQTESEARTIGAVVKTPIVAAGRSALAVPFWGLAPMASSAFTQPGGYQGDAALYVLDTGPVRLDPALGTFVGTNANPLINVAPFDATVGPDPSNPTPKPSPGLPRDGLDPHEPVATSPNAQGILMPFLLQSSGMVDPCVSAGTPLPCSAPPVHAPGQGL
jgi:hypothetical protein